MKQLYQAGLVIVCTLMLACTKTGTNDHSKETKAKADQFKAAIIGKDYRLTAFYSDKPIDYITTDNEVRQETDLWRYVKSYLLDDVNQFTPNEVIITQNALKIPGENADVLHREYASIADNGIVYFKFVDFNYLPLQYKLSAFTDSVFEVYIDWPSGAKLYSRFNRIP